MRQSYDHKPIWIVRSLRSRSLIRITKWEEALRQERRKLKLLERTLVEMTENEKPDFLDKLREALKKL